MVTREEILTTAIDLVGRDGLGALTVRGVASAAGIGATTLRRHFPSQAELYQAVAVRVVGDSLDDIDIHDETRDPVDRLTDGLLQFLPTDDNRELALSGWFELYRLSLGPEPLPAVRAILQSGQGSSAASVRGWFTALSEQGHLAASEIEPNVTRALALIDGLHLNLLIDPERVDLAAARASLRWFAEMVVGDGRRAPEAAAT